MQIFNPLLSSGFVWKNQTLVAEKLNRYKQGGKQLLHVVWDWDGTVVPEPGSAWHTMRDSLPPEMQQQHRALYHHYHTLEVEGQLSGELGREWSSKALDLHVKNHTAMSTIEQIAMRVEPRPGAKPAFEICEQAGVPMVVLSAGIKNIIEFVARAHGMHPSTVLGTELILKDGKVAGWDKDSMIVSQNKQEKGHPELSVLRKQHPHALLFGNSAHDAAMFDGEGLRIRVDGHSKVDTDDWQEYLKESWQAGYDGVTIHDDLLAVAELNKWLMV